MASISVEGKKDKYTVFGLNIQAAIYLLVPGGYLLSYYHHCILILCVLVNSLSKVEGRF